MPQSSRLYSVLNKPNSGIMMTRPLVIPSLYNRMALMRFYKSQTRLRKDAIRTNEYLPVKANNLWPIEGAKTKEKRLGRGNGSGYGKTSGRGMNGQKSRAGHKIRPAFEGGNKALSKRIPKFYGVKAPKKPFDTVHLANIVYAIQKGRIDPTKPITMKELYQSGTVNRIRWGLKLMGNGGKEFDKIKVPLHLEVSDADDETLEAVKSTGGSITAVHHTRTTIRRLLKPHKYVVPQAKIPMPKPREVLKYEKMRERGLDVKYPKAPWYEEYKAKKDQELEEAESREKTPGELILPEYPALRHEGVNLHKPKIEKPELPKNVKYPLP